MMRSLIVVLVASLVVSACSVSESESQTPSTSIDDRTSSSTSTTSSVPVTSTSPPSLSSTTTVYVPDLVVVPVAPTGSAAPVLVWERSDFAADRDRWHWLGVRGDEFVVISERFPGLDRTIQTSLDGITWSEPQAVTGIPDGWWVGADFYSRSLDASGVGLIAIAAPMQGNIAWQERGVFTSSDGTTWRHEDLGPDTGIPVHIAAGSTGFAVVTSGSGEFNGDRLFTSTGNSSWIEVELPESKPMLVWVAEAADGFVARGYATERDGTGITSNLYLTSRYGQVTVVPSPTDYPVTLWDLEMLTWDEYASDPHPSLYLSSGEGQWRRLPMPTYTEGDGAEHRWRFEHFSTGPAGFIGAGCDCPGFWEFRGEGFYEITVTKNEYVVHVSGGKVGVEEPRGQSRIDDSVDTRAWFDEKGTLTLPDNETGEPLVSISCKELRQAASLDTPDWINDFPPGQLWASPDGIAWSQQQVTREFGRGSYVYSTAVNGDTFAALVVPNGDRPIDDPPNCPLNLYPAERPYEIWIASASE